MLTKLTALLCTLSIPAFADFRLTQSIKIEMNRTLPMPPEARESMKSLFEPRVTVIELQGQNLRSRLGAFEILYLLESGVMHVIDIEKRKYTTVSMSDWETFTARLQNPTNDPSVGQAMDKMGNMEWLKINFESKGRGDAGDVAGLGAEVDLYDMKFEINGTPPDPMIARALGSQKMKVAFWTAPMPPSYAEMGSAQRKFIELFGAASSMMKHQGGKSGGSPLAVGEPFMKLHEEYTKKGRLMVRMVMEMYMNFAAMGPAPPELEQLGSEPFMTMTVDTTSFSDAPLDPKMFVVPATYQSISIAELDLQGLMQGMAGIGRKSTQTAPKE